MNFDIIILSHQKDYNKLPFLVDSIQKNITGFDTIHIVSETLPSSIIDGISYHRDQDVLPLDDTTTETYNEWQVTIGYRPNWIFQQYIKLFNIINDKDYLIIDSDTIINKPLDIFVNCKPNFFIGLNQNHIPYFDFIEQILSIKKIFSRSFISEIMFFKKSIIKEILKNFHNDYNEFIQKSLQLTNSSCYISEFELYGNFVMKYFPETYNIKYINSVSKAKYSKWQDEEINTIINEYLNTDTDILSFHSWI